MEESIRVDPSIQVQEVKYSSPEGMKLATEHEILFPPAVFIDGRFFAKGKIGEEDLKKALLQTKSDITS